MTTFIDTSACPKVKAAGNQGDVSEIVNKTLCGAKNVMGMLRWLSAGQRFEAEANRDSHQLVYLMEGEGVITLGGKEYPVKKGAGFYLEPSEAAGIRAEGKAGLKLLHLVVPRVKT
jgi:quercetin dioxygenase-like cupin family protein